MQKERTGRKDIDKLIEAGKDTRFKKGDPRCVEMGRKGGQASQKAYRAEQSLRERVMVIMDAPVKADTAAKIKKNFGLMDATQKDVAAVALVQKAQKGDVQAFETLMELEESSATQDEKTYKLPADIIGEAFAQINRHIEPNKDYIFKGGRGGLKSSYISEKIIELIKNNPMLHACVVRQVQGTLKDSVYAQLKWAINTLGLDNEFEYKVNPLEIKYKKTGQIIYFRGCDDPVKLKSIKPPFGYLGILWVEEEDQIKGEAEERSVKQSVLRGGDITYSFYSYNPPKSKDNWVNKRLLTPDPNRVVHTSNYLQADPDWLGQKFIQDAEHLKEVNPEAYEHEYMGVPNGEGGNVFHTLEMVHITDEQIEQMDWIYQGVDWGDAPDPSVFVRLYYDADADAIYFIDEMYQNHMGNREIAEWIQEHEYDDYEVVCDSAEKRSTRDLIDLGIKARNAKKGAGSVAYGMKWLENRKIYIDPDRTPNVWKEFSEYEFERDKEGNLISGYPDKNNHTIDATRYALERYCNKRYTQA